MIMSSVTLLPGAKLQWNELSTFAESMLQSVSSLCWPKLRRPIHSFIPSLHYVRLTQTRKPRKLMLYPRYYERRERYFKAVFVCLLGLLLLHVYRKHYAIVSDVDSHQPNSLVGRARSIDQLHLLRGRSSSVASSEFQSAPLFDRE